MAKQNQDSKTEATTTETTSRAAFRRPEPTVFASEQDERAWYKEQDRLEREYQEAASKYPPGSRLFVTTARGIARRGRAGLTFTEKGRTEIEVVDMSDDMLAKVRTLTQPQIEKLQKGETIPGLEGLTGRDAARLASSSGFVSPMGAKAIAEDDGLVVFSDAGGKAAADPSEADRRISELEAENKSLREQLAAARRGAAGEGRPERLGRSSSSSAGGGEFGGDEKAKG